MRRLFDALVAVVALLGLAAHLASRAGVRMELAAGLGQSEERQLAILTSLEQKGATRVERGRGKIFADYLRWYQKEHPGLNEDQIAGIYTAWEVSRKLGRSKLTGGSSTSSTSFAAWQRPTKRLEVTTEMYECLFKSDLWNELCRTCCKTLYVPPGAEKVLPMGLEVMKRQPPAEAGLPYGVRFGDFVGHGNDVVFNGANAQTVDFVNRYFGWSMVAVPAPSSLARFEKRLGTYVNGDPNPPPRLLYEVVTKLPEELPNYEGTWVVKASSLPQQTMVVFDDAPAASHLKGEHTPAFAAPYCSGVDPNGKINGGLPVKVEPGDCVAAKEKGIKCTCGHVIILGWVWNKAVENTWDHSLIYADDMARKVCKPRQGPRSGKAPALLPPPAEPRRKMTAKEAIDLVCKNQPEYDPGAQQWYYMKAEVDGGKTIMVRHWCKSDHTASEPFYRYQRYLPRQLNNKPPPPINDFDFMNSYSQVASRPSRQPHLGIDDYTLGNADAGGARWEGAAGTGTDNVREMGFDDADVKGRGTV